MRVLASRLRKKGEDHRSRVGRQRRERTRKHLLESTLHVCSSESPRSPAVIDDITSHAGVSRGTFYTHFDSVEQAISELGVELADEMASDILKVFGALEDPVLRMATGVALFLIRARNDHKWGKFVARIGILRDQQLFTKEVKADIERGIKKGVYRISDIDAASDVVMGVLVEGILRLNEEDRSLDYIKALTQMVLASFGFGAERSAEVVDQAFKRLTATAPGTVSWWVNLDRR